MFFQIVQDRAFSEGAFKPYEKSDKYTHTWNYSKILKEHNVDFAKIWSGGKTLDLCCPYGLEKEWLRNKKKIKGFVKSCNLVGIDTSKLSYFELIPERFLKKFLQNKNQICEHVFSSQEKPLNYDFMLSLHRFLADIKSQTLNLDLDFIKHKAGNLYMLNLWKKLREIKPIIAYNPYGTITGRLSIESGSFPILNISREARDCILPNNDCFIELDFNAAEIRTMLHLMGESQPEKDIHDFNNSKLFNSSLSREEIKKRTFSWLYDPKKKDDSFDKIYNREKVLSSHWCEKGQVVHTPFGRSIKSDKEHALNYIIQSTSSDNFLTQAIKVWNLLKGKKSNVAFTIHDSLVIDFHLSDKPMVRRILEQFSETSLGKFKVNISGGKSFGQMKEMCL